MGRPSKLTDAQWEEIKARLAKGEKAADLAREFKVSKTRISERVSKRASTVKAVANQILAAEDAFRALPVPEQIAAVSLLDEMRAISMHMAGAGKFGAATAHRLSGIAHAKVQEIDDAAPLTDDSRNALRDVAVLTEMANKAANIPLNLLAANKDMTKSLHQEEPVLPVRVVVQVEDASIPEPAA
jgi:hypothetical protein